MRRKLASHLHDCQRNAGRNGHNNVLICQVLLDLLQHSGYVLRLDGKEDDLAILGNLQEQSCSVSSQDLRPCQWCPAWAAQ